MRKLGGGVPEKQFSLLQDIKRQHKEVNDIFSCIVMFKYQK